MRWQRLFLGIGLGLCLTGGQILAEDGITPTSGIFRRYQENCPPALMAPPLGQAIPVPGTAPAPGGEVPRPSTDLLAGGVAQTRVEFALVAPESWTGTGK